jgi:hypothetical protein
VQPHTERELAEWTLAHGGRVRVGLPGGGSIDVADRDKIPESFSNIIRVEFSNLREFNDDLLARAPADGVKVESLYVNNTAVTGEGLAAFRGRRLKTLSVSLCKLSPEGVRCVAEIGSISQLWLGMAGLDDDALAKLADHSELGTLHVANNLITDAGLVHLRGMARLNSLSLQDNRGVTDAGLAHLESLKFLGTLNLRGTRVTATGITKLQAVLPNCEIEWAGMKANGAKPSVSVDSPSGDVP